MTGIVVTGMGIGTLIGAPVANWLISAYDWRTAYIILGSTVLAVIVLVAQLLKRDPTQVGQLPYGENGGEGHGLGLETPGFSLKEAIHTKQLWLVSSMFFCFGFSALAIIVHIAPHVTELGISATTAANIMAAFGGASIVGMVAMGSTADRIGNRRAFIVGFILISAVLLWLIPATQVWMLYLFATVFGLAFGTIAASESPLVAALFGLRSHGLIMGVMVDPCLIHAGTFN